MSNLSRQEKRKLEKALGMESGYVLDFSNRTFGDFIQEHTGIDIYDPKYDYNSGSKANRMRAFWDLESNYTVAVLFEALINEWEDWVSPKDPQYPTEDFLKITQRLKVSTPVPDIGSVVPNSDDKDFETLAKEVRESIDRNEPVAGLDRLHTFLVKYFRVLCDKHGIPNEKKNPLHGLVGQYVKHLRNNDLIQSEMAEKILRSSISNLEAFNYVRNNQSLAHDNQFINHAEAVLIFGHVTSSIRFIEEVERNNRQSKIDVDDGFIDREIPF
ncbi:abortive infection family protein [Shewanella algae]|uniref:abortive infection family protein n=1 Tax=Shewanella algae TaxID=38313 RepID=UPI00118741D3|nr:abortive infection family protein [Shewanella algae]TVO96283.1 hypothetical protein AYI86_13720 [Shewanella algae]